jgi:hypothetical protein
MAWLGAPTAAGTIVETTRYITERLSFIFGTGTIAYTRTRTITVTKYVGLTKAAAETQALTSSALTDCTDAHTERIGDTDGYNALQTIDTITTDWS